MANADLSKLKDKYSNFEMKPKKESPLKKRDTKLSASKRKYLARLAEELFSKFTTTDWIFYFQQQYEKFNQRPYVLAGQKGWTMEHAIYRSLMKEFTPKDIKLLIDFIFESQQDIVPKKQAGGYLFSKKWIQGVYQSAILWQTGEYQNKTEIYKDKFKATTPEKRNREWVKEEEIKDASIKDTKDEAPIIMLKRRKKGKITF